MPFVRLQLVQITVPEPLNGDVTPITQVWAVESINSFETAGGRRLCPGGPDTPLSLLCLHEERHSLKPYFEDCIFRHTAE